jgi:hypothetical protein
VQAPHKVNVYKLLGVIGTNIESIRNGLQSSKPATRDTLFKIIQTILIKQIKEHKDMIVSENTIVSMRHSALIHHLNEAYDEEEVDSSKILIRNLLTIIETNREAQIDCVLRVDKSGISSMRLDRLNLPSYVVLDESSLQAPGIINLAFDHLL